jgi:hypothetical protein
MEVKFTVDVPPLMPPLGIHKSGGGAHPGHIGRRHAAESGEPWPTIIILNNILFFKYN